MENKRALVVAVICFIVAIILITVYVRVRRYEMTKDFGSEIDVVVASRYIKEYETIEAGMLMTVPVFKKFRQPQTMDGKDALALVGKATYVPIYPGEQITLTKLMTVDGKPVLDRQVEKKMRAITIQIAAHTGVGKLIRPGNRVDIIATPHYEYNEATVFEVKTLVQNVLVLATGKQIQNAVPSRVNREVLSAIEQQMEDERRSDLANPNFDPVNSRRPSDNFNAITLQLTPEDAERVLYVSHAFGDQRLYFTLRNSADQTVAAVPTTLLDDVLGPESDYGAIKRKLPAPPPPPPPKWYDNVGGQPVPRY